MGTSETSRGIEDLDVATAGAPMSLARFVDPWHLRVREIDDATVDSLLRFLVDLRRIKGVLSALAAVGGAFVFGLLPVDVKTAVLMHTILAIAFGMPVHAAATLVVRSLFLREAKRNGLSRSAGMLLLVRAERRARHLRPLLPTDTVVERLHEAVRDWDRA